MTPDVLRQQTTAPVAEWTIRVCEECGRRGGPICQQHPDALIIPVRVVPKDIERFHEEVGDGVPVTSDLR